MSRATSSSARNVVGLGFLPEEARHGFLIDIPKGNAGSEMICITEHRGSDLNRLGERTLAAPNPSDPNLRVVIDRNRWLALAPAFWEEARGHTPESIEHAILADALRFRGILRATLDKNTPMSRTPLPRKKGKSAPDRAKSNAQKAKRRKGR